MKLISSLDAVDPDAAAVRLDELLRVVGTYATPVS